MSSLHFGLSIKKNGAIITEKKGMNRVKDKEIIIEKNGKMITLNCLFTFNNYKDCFIVYEVEGKRYASKYQMINNEYKLEDINDNKDWDLVDLYLDKYDKGELL